MRLRAALCCVALSCVVLGGCAERFDHTLQIGALGHFSLRNEPSFWPADAELRTLVAARGQQGHDNHFCLVGYRNAQNERIAEVYWREGQEIFRWGGGGDPEFHDSLRFSKSVELRTGVVGTQAEVGSSTYLVTRDLTEGTLADCARHGEHVTVPAFSP